VATPGLTPLSGSSTAGSSTPLGTAPAAPAAPAGPAGPAASSGGGYGY